MKGNFTFVLPAIVVLNLISNAQVVPQKGLKQCDAPMAQQLVEQQAIESKSTIESDKRINILIRVADYLWDKDNASARKYFSDAFKFAKERFKEKGVANTSTTRFLVRTDPDYRFNVARAVSRRDPEWARKLTEEILKTFDEDHDVAKREPYQQDRELSQSLNLAISLLDSNSSVAVTIIRRLVHYPLIQEWHYALYEIASKNPQLAEQIYSELLAIHSDASVEELLYLSAFPFGTPDSISIGGYSSGNTIPAAFVPNVTLQRTFVMTLLRRVNSLTAENVLASTNQRFSDAAYGVFALDLFAQRIRSNFPELSTDLNRAYANASALMDSETRKNLESGQDYNKRAGKSFADKLLELEENDSKGTLTDVQIVTMILAAKTENELLSLEPWLEKIKEQNVKEKAVNFFYFVSAKLAVKEKRLADARKLADKVPQIEFRAILYFDIADAKLKEPLEKYDTFEILTEVFKIAEKAPDSVEKAQVLLGIGYMFEKIDHANSIEAISKSIRTANKLENPNLFTSKVMQQITSEKFGVFSSYDVPGFDINKTFDQISKKDFQGAISLAEDFSDKYLRTLAVLASVKDCNTIAPKMVKPKEEKSGNPALR